MCGQVGGSWRAGGRPGGVKIATTDTTPTTGAAGRSIVWRSKDLEGADAAGWREGQNGLTARAATAGRAFAHFDVRQFEIRPTRC